MKFLIITITVHSWIKAVFLDSLFSHLLASGIAIQQGQILLSIQNGSIDLLLAIGYKRTPQQSKSHSRNNYV